MKILRVLGWKSKKPGVLAIVDGYRVRWSVTRDWWCDCRVEDCDHIREVAEVIAGQVTEVEPW